MIQKENQWEISEKIAKKSKFLTQRILFIIRDISTVLTI
jgi:hypothetical protein